MAEGNVLRFPGWWRNNLRHRSSHEDEQKRRVKLDMQRVQENSEDVNKNEEDKLQKLMCDLLISKAGAVADLLHSSANIELQVSFSLRNYHLSLHPL